MRNKILSNSIYNENNLLIIQNIPNEYLDGVITDPYFETMGIGNSIATQQDIKSNFIELSKILFKKMKDNSNLIFFCSVKWMMDNKKYLTDIGFIFNYELIWNKNRGVSFLTAKKRPLQKHETIFVFSKGKHNYYWDQCKDIGYHKTKRGKYKITKDYVNTIAPEHLNDGSRFMTTVIDNKVSSYNKHTSHPFEKPLELCNKLVNAYSKPNDIILDPYSGSGNICVALKNNNRNFIGIEINTKYYDESIINLNERK